MSQKEINIGMRGYLNSKMIKYSELSLYFIETQKIKGNFSFTTCPLCNANLDLAELKSEPWTKTFYCRGCKTILFLCIQDRMSGVSEDVLLTFKEK